jgi:O-antigen ligase
LTAISSIGNANDLAAHLILMMSFLVFVLVATKLPVILRLACLPAIGYGLYLIVGTASRGAVVALMVSVLFAFVMGPPKFRLIVLVAAPIAAVVIISAIPREALLRLSTFWSSGARSEVELEAAESSEARGALFRKSLEYTVRFPLFGVGPGQFSTYEGGESIKGGRIGMWHEPHNVFTKASSESGIPGLILFVSALGSGFLLLLKTYRKARGNVVNEDIAIATFCMMLGFVCFMTATTFLNFTYYFYEPALCGMCIVLYNAANHEMTARKNRPASALPAPLPWAPAQPFGVSPSPAPVFSSKLR